MNSNINWELRIKNRVYKELAKLPLENRGQIIKVVDNLPHNPFAGDIEKIEGEENTWRRRVGAYRIFYEIVSQDRIIYVFRVERRTSSTY
mgnify:CR=1 FL=1